MNIGIDKLGTVLLCFPVKNAIIIGDLNDLPIELCRSMKNNGINVSSVGSLASIVSGDIFDEAEKVFNANKNNSYATLILRYASDKKIAEKIMKDLGVEKSRLRESVDKYKSNLEDLRGVDGVMVII